MKSITTLKVNKIIRAVLDWYDSKRIVIIRSIIVFTVLVACLLLAPNIVSGSRLPTFMYFGLLAISSLILILKWPIIGIFSVLIGGMFVPIALRGGFNVSQIGLAAMLGILIFDLVILKREINFIKSRTFLPIFAFIIISIISFLFGQFSWYSFARNAPIEAQLGGMAIHILSAGGFILVAQYVNDLKKLEYFTWTFIVLSFVYVFGRAINLWQIDQIFVSGFSNGSLFWVWLTAMLAGQLFCNKDIQFSKRVILGLMLLAVFYVALVQSFDWKSGWFPPLISLFSIIALRYWHNIRYFAILAIIPLYLIATNSVGQEDWSWGTRLDAWLIVLTIAQVSPILGMGFANYYWYTPLFPIRGYFVQFNSHSQIVDLIAQTGILGLSCFLWFFGEVTLLGFRLIKKGPEGFAKGYIYGVLGGIAGTLIAAYLVDWVLPFVYNIGMTGFRASILAWMFMGGIVSLEQIIRKSESH